MKSYSPKFKNILHRIILATIILISGFVFSPVISYADPYTDCLAASGGSPSMCAGASGAPSSSGAQQYTVLAPLPGTTNDGGNCTGTNCQADLSHYLPGLFNLLIGVGAVAAFVIITIYGLELMLSDSLSTKMNAKTMLENALWGLGLVIFAWVILYTINPKLLNGNLNITTPTIPAPSGGALVVPGTSINETSARTSIQLGYPLIAIPPACPTGQTTGCTNVAGVTTSAITGVQSLQNDCGCAIAITGGTEHHPAGNMLDISPTASLNTYLGQPANLSTATSFNKTLPDGQTVNFSFEPAGQCTPLATGGCIVSTGNHWHVTF